MEVVFSELDLDIRSSMKEIKILDKEIAFLTSELHLAKQQQKEALKALANSNMPPQPAIDCGLDPHVQQRGPPTVLLLDAVVAAPAPVEEQSRTQQPHVDITQLEHRKEKELLDAQRQDVAGAVSGVGVHVQGPNPSTVDRPGEAGAGEASPAAAPTVPSLTAEGIKKRLLQVLRHLRDTAACCRQISDLDRGFSNMLKTTYKELYDSLKEVTSKGVAAKSSLVNASGTAAAAAVASVTACGSVSKDANRSGMLATAADNTAAPAPSSAAMKPMETPTGAGVQSTAGPAATTPGGGRASNVQTSNARNLSALALLVHSKRLHQQADGSCGPTIVTRDLDQPPAKRTARATLFAPPGSRLPALYDGLPPARVAASLSQGSPLEAGPALPAAQFIEQAPVALRLHANELQAVTIELASTEARVDGRLQSVGREATPYGCVTAHGDDGAGGSGGGGGGEDISLQKLQEQARTTSRAARSPQMSAPQLPVGTAADRRMGN